MSVAQAAISLPVKRIPYVSSRIAYPHISALYRYMGGLALPLSMLDPINDIYGFALP